MKSKNIPNDVTKDMTMIFDNRLEKTVGKTETTFNLSNEDMQNVTNFINTIDKSNDGKLLGLTKDFGRITDLLQKVQVGLESVPKDDDVGPIISELQQENRELGRLESEFKNLEDLEFSNHGSSANN